MLHNACEHLNVGGYFIGIIPNSFEILRHFKKKGFGKISNDIFEIRMDSYENKLFGSVYNFKLDELVDCPEFLIYFPLLKEMLLKYNMRCVKWQSLCHFFLENFDSNFQSLQNMKALKCFNTKELNHLNSSPILDGLNYSHINDSLMKKKMKLEDRPLSLSVEEWQVVRFYSVFVFQRDPPSISPSSDIRLIAVENDKEDTKKD
ncbi:hypothetical protein HZS_1530 [Henneguya salminicola]|nr:hypothetical protein HZS_1530 [Henneguya salminicola]